MKNLLIYINPRHDFGDEEKVTIKIQIDNSLDLGWKKEDILLVTNFPYEYNGVKAIVVGDENYCESMPTTSKINTVVELFKPILFSDIFVINAIIDLHNKSLIDRREIYFYHDIDLFQNEVITQSEIERELGEAEVGITDKGRMPLWNTGTIFFRESAADIFKRTKEVAYEYGATDESALMVLYTNNLLWATEPDDPPADRFVPANIPGMENAGNRIKKINITYNFRRWNIRSTYKIAYQPIRAVQFHPFANPEVNDEVRDIDFFLYGKNKINAQLVPQRLVKIFNKHGIR